ncbi:MAG: homocitrate synthase/isopropylmalate synthase family protein [Peptococcales bacterium]|jgi:isopropylmalate/homocitrate/citramalate synthase
MSDNVRLNMENGPWKKDNWWVSHFNFADEVTKDFSLPAQVEIHDSTLRDGEQAAGVSFNKEQKIQIAKMLDKAGVQYIEAGFPAVSQETRDALKEISNLGLNAKITCLCRATEGDIDLAKECDVWGAIMEVPVSYPRLKYQFGWEEKQVIEKALRVATYAKEKGLYTYLFLIDSTRAHLEFLEELLTTVVPQAGVDRVTLVDTNGCINPPGMKFLMNNIKKWVEVPIEVHCHNDFGLGVANALISVENGASSVSSVLNSLGQRAGNTSTEEVAFALECLYGVKTGIDFKALYEVSRLVAELSGWSFPPNKPIVGKNLFTWEAGIPTAALMKNPHTVEPFQPEIFGVKHDVKVGKKSGKANVIWKARELGLELTDQDLEQMVKKIKDEADRLQRTLTDEEFLAIFKSIK